MVYAEAGWVAQNINQQEASRAVLLQLAVSSILSKKAGKNFEKTIKNLTGG